MRTFLTQHLGNIVRRLGFFGQNRSAQPDSDSANGRQHACVPDGERIGSNNAGIASNDAGIASNNKDIASNNAGIVSAGLSPVTNLIASETLDWLPDWRKLIADGRLLWAEKRKQARDSGQKILIATSTGGHDAVTPIESMLSVALTLRGADVRMLLCDGILPACLQATIGQFPEPGEFVRFGPRNRLCDQCFSRGYFIFDTIGLPIHRLSSLISRREAEQIAEINRCTAYADIPTFVLDGVPVGDHAHAGALRYFARGILDGEADAEAILRRYFDASLMSLFAAKRLITEEKLDTLVMNHGLYVPHGPMVDFAHQTPKHTQHRSFAYRSQCAMFSHDQSDIFALIEESNDSWESLEWNSSMDRQLTDYLDSRIVGKKDWMFAFQADSQSDISLMHQNLGIDPNKPTFGLLTNIIWDAQLHFKTSAFPSMVDWMLQTIAYFERRPDLQLLIRIHPGETKITQPSRQLAMDEIRRRFPHLPKNVFIVPTESNDNTYILMSHCQAVLIYGTSMGMDLASMGIPVIIAGQAWMRGRGFSYDASTEAEYFSILDSLPLKNRRLSSEETRRARMYAFHYYFRRTIPIGLTYPRDGWPILGVRADSLEDLMPGVDKGLDVICEGIMNRTPFVYPAEKYLDYQH